MQLYHAVLAVESGRELPAGGGITPGEVTDVGWFGRDELPPLHHGHTVMVPAVFELLSGERSVPYLDLTEPT